MKGKTNQMSEGEQYALQDEWGWEEEVCKEAEEEEEGTRAPFAAERVEFDKLLHSMS